MNWGLALHAVEFFLWVAVGLYSWQIARHQATQRDIDQLKQEIHRVELRFTRLEERMTHMPTAETLSELSANVGRLAGEVEGLREQGAAISRQYERVDDYLKRVHG